MTRIGVCARHTVPPYMFVRRTALGMRGVHNVYVCLHCTPRQKWTSRVQANISNKSEIHAIQADCSNPLSFLHVKHLDRFWCEMHRAAVIAASCQCPYSCIGEWSSYLTGSHLRHISKRNAAISFDRLNLAFYACIHLRSAFRFLLGQCTTLYSVHICLLYGLI